jgi:hypothetical protein
MLPTIYRTLGLDYAERVLPSIIQVRGSGCSVLCSRRHVARGLHGSHGVARPQQHHSMHMALVADALRCAVTRPLKLLTRPLKLLTRSCCLLPAAGDAEERGRAVQRQPAAHHA